MSKKHFDEYFLNSQKMSDEILDTLKKLQKDFEDQLIDEDSFNSVCNNMRGPIDSHQTLHYIKYLLDQPDNPKKIPVFRNTQKNILKKRQRTYATQLHLLKIEGPKFD